MARQHRLRHQLLCNCRPGDHGGATLVVALLRWFDQYGSAAPGFRKRSTRATALREGPRTQTAFFSVAVWGARSKPPREACPSPPGSDQKKKKRRPTPHPPATTNRAAPPPREGH